MADTPYHHKSLRNRNINYRAGWWSVSIQVAKNKSIFGAVVGDRVVLNALGCAVEEYWRSLPTKYPELEIFDFVVMPNHFHALHGLWQRDYWDDLITGEAEFKGWQKYIRENPANWSSDRYGACTAYVLGDVELLNRPRVAFVASQGFYACELRPRKIWARTAKAVGFDKERGGGADNGAKGVERVLISTFTSAQEREALRRALAKKRPLVAVFPAGIPVESEMVAGLVSAIHEGWALAVSPQATGSRLNKKIATWCNEFLIKNADEIWVGDLSPNGMLTQMLRGLGRLSMVGCDVSKRSASAAQEEVR